MNSEELAPADNSPIVITNGPNAKVVHFGSKFGPECGTGFNRRGSVPQVTRVDAPITCTKKACASHA